METREKKDNKGFEVPILLLVYNRPELTRRVLQTLERVKPRRLYVVADGPKTTAEDRIKCQLTRELFNELPWVCSVKKLFRENNLGCGVGVSEGITWFFTHVKEGIILEDDCVANRDFFRFCEILLERYRHHESIFHIGGNNFQDGKKRGKGSYYFSVFPHVWGWATWRRAWAKYDYNIDPKVTINYKSISVNYRIQEYFQKLFEMVSKGKIDTWDYQWLYTCWKYGGLCISPNVNLVTNIGFGKDATHTRQENSTLSNIRNLSISFPLVESEKIEIDRKADYRTFRKVFKPKKGFYHYSRLLKQKAKSILMALKK